MRPTLVFDGDCSVCTSLARFVTARCRCDASDYDVTASQHADLPALGLTQERCDAALQWVDAEGGISSAQDAVARTLLASSWWARPMGALILLPGVRGATGAVYRWAAHNRHRLPGGTSACAMTSENQH